MTIDKVDCIRVEKWTVGIATNSLSDPPPTVLMLEFENREPINLAFLPDEVMNIARAILEQYANPPPPLNRYS